MLKIIPDIPMEFAQAIRDLGLVLLNDDVHDIGYFSYYGRKNHVYKGKVSPNHPSPFHHWQVAIGMLFAAKFMGMISLARENMEAYHEFELEETLEERTINYKQYMQKIEVSGYKKSTIPDPQRIEFNDYEVIDNTPPIEPQEKIDIVRPRIEEAIPIIPPQNKLVNKVPRLSIRL